MAASAALPTVDQLTASVTAHALGSAGPSSVLLSELTAFLFPTCTAEAVTVDAAASLLNAVFDALPSTSTESERESLDQAPTTHFQLLQTAALDALWTLDVLFDSNGEVWPSPANAPDASPHRFRLRQLLALLAGHIPLPLQKLRIALTIATDPATEGRIAQGEVRMRTGM
jgi:hypothetical protein